MSKIEFVDEYKIVDLEVGEKHCSNCEGYGHINILDNTKISSRCVKCNGSGKLDWIESIVGKKKPSIRRLNSGWTIDIQDDLTAIHGLDLESQIVNDMSDQIAKDVDDDILKSIIGESEECQETIIIPQVRTIYPKGK